jgi:hypothetical protein
MVRVRLDHREPAEGQPSGAPAPLLREAAARPHRDIVPFFDEHPLITAKRHDYERFATVLQMMQAGRHLTQPGLAVIARLTEQMNRRQRSRFLESSEAIRQPPHDRL